MSYVLIVGAGLRTAVRTERTFEKLLAVGLTTIVGIQAFIIIGGVHQGHSAHRHHAAVRQLRRLVADRQLHPARPPHPRQRLRRAPPQRTARRSDHRRAVAGVAALAAHPSRDQARRRSCRLRRGRVMNRSIRQLALGLMVCYVVLFVALNYWQVGAEGAARRQVRQHPPDRCASSTGRAATIITADGVVAARSLPDTTNENVAFVRDYPTGDLLADVTGYFTKDFGSTQLERQYGDVLAGSTAEQQVRGLGDLLEGNVDNSGTVQLTLREDAPGGRQVRCSADRDGFGHRARPQDRRHQCDVLATPPSTRTPSSGRLRRRAAGDHRPAERRRQSAAHQGLPRPLHARIDVQGDHHRHRPRSGSRSTLETTFPNEREWVPPQTNDPIQNYNASECGGDLAEVFRRSCNIPFAKTAIELGADRFVAGTAGLGNRRADPDRPASRRHQHDRQHRRPQPRPCPCWRSAASVRAKTRWCRCTWRWSPRRWPTADR